jgi:hypothetical protein
MAAGFDPIIACRAHGEEVVGVLVAALHCDDRAAAVAAATCLLGFVLPPQPMQLAAAGITIKVNTGPRAHANGEAATAAWSG